MFFLKIVDLFLFFSIQSMIKSLSNSCAVLPPGAQHISIILRDCIDFKKLDNCSPNILTLIDKKVGITNFKYNVFQK